MLTNEAAILFIVEEGKKEKIRPCIFAIFFLTT
jgi:hypothetical protein